MDTPTLRGLWLAAVDAPLAPAVRLVTAAGLALLGVCVPLAAAAWVRVLRSAAGPIRARPGGADASLLAWRVGRLGLGALALAAGARAVALAPVPGPPVASDVHRIAEVLGRWDREAAGEVTTLASGSRATGPPRAGPPRTHRMPDV